MPKPQWPCPPFCLGYRTAPAGERGWALLPSAGLELSRGRASAALPRDDGRASPTRFPLARSLPPSAGCSGKGAVGLGRRRQRQGRDPRGLHPRAPVSYLRAGRRRRAAGAAGRRRRRRGGLSEGHRRRCSAGRSPAPSAAGGAAAGGRRRPGLAGGCRGAPPARLRRRARPCPRRPAAAEPRPAAGARWRAAPAASSPLASLRRWEEAESEGGQRRARPAPHPPAPHAAPGAPPPAAPHPGPGRGGAERGRRGAATRRPRQPPPGAVRPAPRRLRLIDTD